MNSSGGLARRSVFSSALWLIVIYLVVVPAMSQTSSAREGKIGKIDIDGLVPLQISFVFQNTSQVLLEEVQGKATLNDRSGNRVGGITIRSFSIKPGHSIRVEASSRWELQKPGIYLLQVTLDIGRPTLVSKSLPFRIKPITLPLAPPEDLEGEGLYTVSQQPANWGIPKIEAPKARHTTHGTDNVVVAVIDSGIDFGIPQLAKSQWVNQDEVPNNGIDDDNNGYTDDIHGWDFRDNDNSSLRGSSIHLHGTFIASIIAAWPGENAIVGVAPGVRIMDIRFLDSKNRFYGSDWEKFARAIDYAVDNGARIINLSVYAKGKPPRVLKKALRQARERGVIVVGIVGNEGLPQVSYPAKYGTVISVSMTNQDDQLATRSNYGDEVMFAAPGKLITSLIPGGATITKSGTSFAAAHVTGVLALILSVNPYITAPQALDVLKESAVDLGNLGRDKQFGYGLVNAANALTHVSSDKQTISSNHKLDLRPIGDSVNVPQDLDKDGFYEDINGDGTLADEDPVILGFNMDNLEVIKNWRAFDFNNDGVLDFKDVIALKEMVKSE